MYHYVCVQCTTRLVATETPAGQPVLECPTCKRTVDKTLARYAEYACRKVVLASDLPRLTPTGKVYVPSTDPRNAGRDVGHLVDPATLECSCGKAGCRHRGRAKTFLKMVA